MSIESKIIELLKAGASQNAVSKELGVPRSKVQKVSDAEFGVSPDSFKDLTLEDIAAIKGSDMTNAALATQFGVNVKVIARARLAVLYDNNVVSFKTDNTIAEGVVDSHVLEVGGFAKAGAGTPNLYLAHYIEATNKYLGFFNDGKGFDFGLFDGETLHAIENSDGFTQENLTHFSQLTEAVLNFEDVTEDTNVYTIGAQKHYLVEVFKDDIYSTFSHDKPLGFIHVGIDPSDYEEKDIVWVDWSSVQAISSEVDSQEEVVLPSKKALAKVEIKPNAVQVMFLPTQVIVSRDGSPRTIDTSHPSYDNIVEALKSEDYDTAFELMDPKKTVEKFTMGRIRFEGKKVTWDGLDVPHKTLVARVVDMAIKGDQKNLQRFTKFLDKLYENPSSRLIPRIFDFMAFADIEVDDDGDLIVYKCVKSNYRDKHTNTVDNSPGSLVRMARSFVDEADNNLCSYGLHVCSMSYLKTLFGKTGDRVVRVKLNPANIVSVPTDYGNAKIRSCEYYVMDDYTANYNSKNKTLDMEGFYK